MVQEKLLNLLLLIINKSMNNPERLRQYLEAQRARVTKDGSLQEAKNGETNDIATLAENYGVNVLSAIRTYGNLGQFRPLDREEFKGVRLFDMLLRPNQIASCSTVTPGDTEQNLYSRWGVVLGEGKIHEAFPYDAVTSVKEGKVVSKFSSRMKNVPLSERIAYTIFSRQLYNELSASIEGISGIYYCLEEGETNYKDFPSDKVQDLLSPLGIPQYLLRNGSFYHVEDLRNIKKDQIGKKMSPTEIVQTVCKPTPEQKDVMTEYLTDKLTLAPRNPITSGVTRGQFAYAYRSLDTSAYEDFYTEQLELISDENPSLQLYSAMASYAFGEAAAENRDEVTRNIFHSLGAQVLDYEGYQAYKARILETGNLAITKEDFLYYLRHEKLPPHLQDH